MRMSEHDWMVNVAVGAIVASSLVVVVTIVWLSGAYLCSSKWDQSGMATSWGPFKGCQLQHQGKWIPADSYREMP